MSFPQLVHEDACLHGEAVVSLFNTDKEASPVQRVVKAYKECIQCLNGFYLHL